MSKKKPYISPSQVASYTRCGEAYRRRYREHEIIPPSISLTKGQSVHKGSQFNFEEKITSHVDLKSDEVVDYAVATYEQTVENEGVLLTPTEQSKGKATAIGEGKDTTAALAQVMMKDVHPKYQPRAVEKEVFVELPSSTHDLKGYIDCETVDNKIIDLKTSAKAWNQERVERDFQFTFYAMMFRAINKKDPADVVVENLVSYKSGAKALPFSTQRGMDHYEPAIFRLNRVLEGINADIFTPANDGAWWCSPVYCGYHSTCKFVKK